MAVNIDPKKIAAEVVRSKDLEQVITQLTISSTRRSR